MAEKWWAGGSDGQQIYRGPEGEIAEIVGEMNTPELAAEVVLTMNQAEKMLTELRLAMEERTPDEWPPAPDLVDFAPDTLVRGHWCGCNQPEAVHIWGDAGFCRVTLAAVAA